MDTSISQQIKQAASHLKSRDLNAARSILVELLKEHPESEQAWFLLSFTTSDIDRQEYALSRVLKINPKHQKAAERLEKIKEMTANILLESTDSGADETADHEQYQSKTEHAEAPAVDSSPFPVTKPFSDEDLLSQRIFGNDNPEEGTGSDISVADEDNLETKKKRRLFGIEDENLLQESIRFWKIVGIVFAVIFTIGLLVFLIFKLYPGANSDSPMNNATLSSETSAAPSISVSTATPKTITEPTAEEIDVQENQAPKISVLPQPNQIQPEQQAEIPAEFSQIQPLIVADLGLTSPIYTSVSMVNQATLINNMEGAIATSEFLDWVAKNTLTNSLLGLSDSRYSQRTHFLNLWSEPSGGFFDPISNTIYLLDSQDQTLSRSLYAFEYSQALIDGQLDFDQRNLFPVCQLRSEYCAAALAFVKGASASVQSQFATVDYSDPISIYDMDYIPPYAELDLTFPYVQGQQFFEFVQTNGDPDFLSQLMIKPPTTTEQILHPEKYLAHEEVLILTDQSIGTDLGDEWQEITVDSLGEWKTYLFLGYGYEGDFQLDDETAQLAAAGWGNDRYQIYKNNLTGQTIFFGHWNWDTRDDWGEFNAAVTEKYSKQYGTPFTFDETLACWQVGQVTCLKSTESDSFLLMAPDMDTIDRLLELQELGT